MGAGLEWGVGQSTQGVHEGETVLANSTIARHPGQCGDRPVCPHRAGRWRATETWYSGTEG